MKVCDMPCKDELFIVLCIIEVGILTGDICLVLL